MHQTVPYRGADFPERATGRKMSARKLAQRVAIEKRHDDGAETTAGRKRRVAALAAYYSGRCAVCGDLLDGGRICPVCKNRVKR